MVNTIDHQWNSQILSSSILYEPLQMFDFELRKYHDWPELNDYQKLLSYANTPVLSGGKKRITFVPQGEKPQLFEQHYESRIYLKGEVQTRVHNWHDFFQVLVWTLFPKTKQALNKQHYLAAQQRLQSHSSGKKNRSPLENALTLFDECGAIVVSSNKTLFELIRTHQWKMLFWKNKERLQKELQCLTFGHALYEKNISPYIGMTVQSLLILVPDELLHVPNRQRLTLIDELVAEQFNRIGSITAPKDLSPFPILGMPGWHVDNCQESFYDNISYFRPLSRKIRNGHK